MSTLRRGHAREKGGRHYGQVRIGKDEKISFPIPNAKDKAEANAFAALAAEVVSVLIAGGRASEADGYARQAGAAESVADARLVLRAVKAFCAAGPSLTERAETMSGLSKAWVDGDLHKRYPDRIKKKRSAFKDGQIFKRHIEPHVGPIPVQAFTLDHAEMVMAKLPDGLSPAMRRHVAQVLSKLLRMAAYPLRLIPASPLPRGFLPTIPKGRAKAWLYPKEDALLLGCETVPLDHRVLYGFLSREGMRVSEALAIEWTDVDLDVGAIRLDKNKTDDPRAWKLGGDVVRALAAWKRMRPNSKGPFSGVAYSHIADRLREHLEAAGVTRAELFERSGERRPIRIHDLRGTFVTISLANGRSETWVQDRTGHGSTLMINRYRKAARHASELELGPLAPLDEAIVWRQAPRATGGTTGGNGNENGGKKMVGKRSRNGAVAPPGLEPGCPLGPEILSRAPDLPPKRKRAKRLRNDVPEAQLRQIGSGEIPPVYAGLAEGLAVQRVTWAAFDLFTFEEGDGDA